MAARLAVTMLTGGLSRGDRRALAVLLAIPVVVFVVPALFGHPIVNADNEIQNLPLRALAGADLRHGRLPLWDPYIWSGSPLLGGLNAGALYPFTWLFAFMPVLAAWTVNLMVVYITAAVGTYAFLRQQALRPVSAGFAAASFAFAGSMSAQMVHIGIVQGASWIPWMLLLEQRIAHRLLNRTDPSRSAPRPSVWGPVTVLGMLGGLVLLTGEPRGMADAAVVVGLAALWHLVTGHAPWKARARFLTSFVMATLLAAALGAVQLIPGWSFISDSQRAQSTVAFFGTGSLPVRWSLLMFVPDLMGGTGIHQPAFFSNYNLPEVTGYVGLLPLMAAGGLLARSFGRRRHEQAPRWIPWFGLVIVGMVLSYGQYTPLGPFLAHLPFFGILRLQSRNLVVADLGLCVLLAYWLEIVLPMPSGRLPRRVTRIATIVPATAVAVICLVALVWPAPFEEWLGVAANAAHLGRGLAPSLALALALAVAAIAVGLGYGHLQPRTRTRVFGALMALDLLIFTVTSVPAMSLEFTTAQIPSPSSAVAVAAGTRFAVFDPGNEYLAQFSSLGQNDLNTLVNTPSVEGYGSLTDNGYQTATGTRTHNTLNPCALAEGAFVALDLGTLLTVANDLMQTAGTPSPTLSSIPDTSCPVAAPASPTRVWWFGRPLSVVTATVVYPSDVPTPSVTRVGLLSETGGTDWTPATVTSGGNELTIHFAAPVVGSGLVLAGPGSARATDATTVTIAGGGGYVMNGFLQSALRDASFHFHGYRNGIAVFRTTETGPPVFLRPRQTARTSSRAATVGTTRRVATTSWGRETDDVTVHRPATLVRSEAFSVGWQARVLDITTERAVTLPVIRVGLIQGVQLAPGHYTVTWAYRPMSVTVGFFCTLAGTILVVGAGALWFGRRRRVSGEARPYGGFPTSGATTRAGPGHRPPRS
jgi:hypothetical protein